jgi:hypothetical protein
MFDAPRVGSRAVEPHLPRRDPEHHRAAMEERLRAAGIDRDPLDGRHDETGILPLNVDAYAEVGDWKLPSRGPPLRDCGSLDAE